ncbi:MAG: malto-oligosyltrehalose trehalohydrolase [Micrococcales bacterium]|nr:malto-oligosyltrehalose trehalohydrolase [Micrococcales bacterium]
MIPRVWAPRPDEVRLWVDGGSGGAVHPMHPTEGGWWASEGAPLSPGSRWGYHLFGEGLQGEAAVIADPRARRMPEGVHGPGQVVPGYAAPQWDGRELAGGVIYELHVGTFTPTGTLESAIERLPDLADLGVDFVELLPVNGFNGAWNWGYDGVAWFTVQESYGGPDAYLRFVATAHTLGLGVIQDVVYNHLGASGNHLPQFGPYLRSGSRNTWGDSVNFDEPEVRRFVLDNARMWLEDYGVDGLRLDAVHALVDEDSPRHILRELADQTAVLAERLGRPLSLIAESDLNDPRMIAEDGHGMTAQWSDDYHHAVHVALTGETEGYYADFASLEALGKAWSQGFFHDGTYSSFRDREHGSPIPAEIPPSRLVVFAQDHDQIGNRAAGDRLAASLSTDRLLVGAVLTLAAPGTPMLFMGEEWAASTPWQFFTSHPEPELGKATAEGRIAEFERMGWDPSVVPDPQDPGTFERSRLDWSERDEPPHDRVLAAYRELLRLRRATPELGGVGFPELSAEVDDAACTAALRSGAVTVYANLGTAEWTVPADELLFATCAEVSSPVSGTLVLPPDSAVITRLAPPGS